MWCTFHASSLLWFIPITNQQRRDSGIANRLIVGACYATGDFSYRFLRSTMPSPSEHPIATAMAGDLRSAMAIVGLEGEMRWGFGLGERRERNTNSSLLSSPTVEGLCAVELIGEIDASSWEGEREERRNVLPD
ncbi:hypothetical protein L1049_011450 [Liquidambar formosana]|uniref:Uncharacterized protein n=1 Tax=Liquidambar formosana TaxID=63359 RepID=A0AAP0RRT9_LIQFO